MNDTKAKPCNRPKWGIALLTGLWLIGAAHGADIQRDSLPNGMSLLLYPSQATDNVAIILIYAIGEDHDPADKCGLGHLVEHVYMTAAAGKLPARTAQEFMDKYPDGWNARNGIDSTVFATVFPKDQLEAELKEAAMRMSDLRVTQADLDREKPRMIDELRNMYGGVPRFGALNMVRQLVRPSPVGHIRGGLPAHIEKMTVEDVQSRWAKCYKPASASLAIVGGFDPPLARRLVHEHFARIEAGTRPVKSYKPIPGKFGDVETVTIAPRVPNALPHVSIAFAAPTSDSDLFIPTLMITNRLRMNATTSGSKARVFFPPLDDPTIIALTGPVKKGKTPDEAIAELRAFVDVSIDAPMEYYERDSLQQGFGVMLGFAEPPPVMFKRNLYGVAYSLARREQMGIDMDKLRAAVNGVSAEKIEAAGKAIFAPDRQATMVVQVP